jgi:hypothetical protein
MRLFLLVSLFIFLVFINPNVCFGNEVDENIDENQAETKKGKKKRTLKRKEINLNDLEKEWEKGVVLLFNHFSCLDKTFIRYLILTFI